MAELTVWAGNSIYGFQALVAVIGTYCSIMVWRRLGQIRFTSEEDQGEFLDQVQASFDAGDFDAASEICTSDGRALPQLTLLAIANRALPFGKVRDLVAERFQRDVISDMEQKMIWVFTAIKSAPMLGLLGTVLGMMAAFQKLAEPGKRVDPQQLSGDISLALITTFVGLSIAIPLSLAVSSVQIRMRKMEELIGLGITRMLEGLKATSQAAAEGVR